MSLSIAKGMIQRGHAMSLATVADGHPHVCTVFYATLDERRLWFKSRVASVHSQAFADDERAAAAIFDPSSTYTHKAGVQLRGTVKRIDDPAEMEAAVRRYSEVFEGAAEKFDELSALVSPQATSTMYAFDVDEYKLVDSRADVLVDAFERFVE